jgi:hypothetical protein
MKQRTLPCFKCGKELTPVMSDNPFTVNQPYSGTRFTTGGHYGSTVFDPMQPYLHLEVNICDECLVSGKERVLLSEDKPQRIVTTYHDWDPEKEL